MKSFQRNIWFTFLFLLSGCVGLAPRQPVPALAYEVVATAQLTYLGNNAEGKLKRQPRDCSDFIQKVYRAHGFILPRTAKGQAGVGRIVRKRNLVPGDLVFFSRHGWTGRVDHVGLYTGDGKFLHVSDKRRRVVWASLDEDYFRKRYLTARRIIE